MSKKEHKQAGHNIGPWLLTYADMVTLMLGCFVMLASMSEIKKNDNRYRQAVQSIQRAFGLPGWMGDTTGKEGSSVSAEKLVQAVVARAEQLAATRSNEKGVPGKDPAVKTMYEGQRYAIGGAVHFDENSALLTDQAKNDLRHIADQIRGLTMKVEVVGHTSTVPPPKGSSYRDNMDLAAARARAVLDWLADPTQGRIALNRLRLAACGDTQPLRNPAYDRSDLTLNDRVEVLLTEALVSDFVEVAAPSATAWNGATPSD
jgi:chemotaxis protein MotB